MVTRTLALETHTGHFVCAEDGGGPEGQAHPDGQPFGLLVATRQQIGAWETFTLEPLDEGYVALRAANGQYVCADQALGGLLVANRAAVGPWERFKLVVAGDPVTATRYLGFQAVDGRWIRAEGGGGSSMRADGVDLGVWETFRVHVIDGDWDEPTPRAPVLVRARATWGDLLHPRGTFGAGSFAGSTEFPGLTDDAQDRFLDRWVERGDTVVQFALVNGDESPLNGLTREAYDLFTDRARLRTVLLKLAERRLMPLMSLFQGADASWVRLCQPIPGDHYVVKGERGARLQTGYCNEKMADGFLDAWVRDVLEVWDEVCREAGTFEGRPLVSTGLVYGWESDEKFGWGPFPLPGESQNPDNKGFGEKYGFAAGQEVFGKIVFRASGGRMLFAGHYLTDQAGPRKGAPASETGGRDFGGPRGYHLGQGNVTGRNWFWAVSVQTAAGREAYTRPIATQQAVLRTIRRELDPCRRPDGGPLLVWAGEYAEEGGADLAASDRRAVEVGDALSLVSDGRLNG